jgi:hypothetical protein
MGIGCRLRRAETANRAREDAQLAMAERVRAAAGNLTGRLDGCCEVCEADSKHRGARAGRESVAVRSRVDIQVSIVMLKKSRRLWSEAPS